MISTSDIHWAAGFIDADGCVAKQGSTIAINAVQKDRWPLDKLASIFGGKVRSYARKEVVGRSYYRWELYGSKAAGVMMTLFTLMSPRRQKRIQELLSFWTPLKRGNANAKKTHCKYGHEYTVENTYLKKGGGRECRACQRAANLRYRTKLSLISRGI